METPAITQVVDADHCLATWDRTLIQIWRRATTEQAVANMGAFARVFVAKHAARANLLFIVERESDIPGAAARAEFAQFTKETARQMACCVVVPEGDSFRSALVRSVAVGLTVLTRNFPYQFVENVDAAVDRLGPYVAVPSGGRDALRRAVTDVRERIARSNPPA